jgi:hypothetical protein
MSQYQTMEGLPNYSNIFIPEDEEECGYDLLKSNPGEYLRDYLGADCWAIVSKYKCSPEEYVVEFNSFPLEKDKGETRHIFNPTHPEYCETIRKILKRQRRKYLMDHPEEYLEMITECKIYMGTGTLVRIFRGESCEWNVEFFQ